LAALNAVQIWIRTALALVPTKVFIFRFCWPVHGWELMSNHYHWLIETPEANLVEGMRWVQNT